MHAALRDFRHRIKKIEDNLGHVGERSPGIAGTPE
jgi:hypothetical protein